MLKRGKICLSQKTNIRSFAVFVNSKLEIERSNVHIRKIKTGL